MSALAKAKPKNYLDPEPPESAQRLQIFTDNGKNPGFGGTVSALCVPFKSFVKLYDAL